MTGDIVIYVNADYRKQKLYHAFGCFHFLHSALVTEAIFTSCCSIVLIIVGQKDILSAVDKKPKQSPNSSFVLYFALLGYPVECGCPYPDYYSR